ncbi:MAG: hypothetical protein A2177_07320 [Spirochaetes bacterium RBG_13_68_11]|nr:MAG: hypothetical protein A2177_07320 [Spirochaetes bacterium RBG_13_68_11]
MAPCHPVFRSEIGLNVGYTQAMGTQGIINCQLLPDPLLQYEISPRLYRRASFAAPSSNRAMICGVSLESSHTTAGSPVKLRVAAPGTGATVLSTAIRQGKRTLKQSRVSVKATAELTTVDVPLDADGLAPGECELEVRDAAGIARRLPFGILPALDPSALHVELAASGTRLPAGSLRTLEFRLQEVERGMAQLRPHAVGTTLGSDLAALESDFQALLRGEDPVAKPKPGRTYPVVVFLHGSASDDRGQLDGMKGMLPGFILVAPYAWGTSHFYTTEEAQEDIREVLVDVEKHYPVDPERIFLSGFSMGGYGVYRTFS